MLTRESAPKLENEYWTRLATLVIDQARLLE